MGQIKNIKLDIVTDIKDWVSSVRVCCQNNKNVHKLEQKTTKKN